MRNQFGAVYQQGRPAWMREGTLEASLLEGHDDLEVVGESRHQENHQGLRAGTWPDLGICFSVFLIVTQCVVTACALEVPFPLRSMLVGLVPRWVSLFPGHD